MRNSEYAVALTRDLLSTRLPEIGVTTSATAIPESFCNLPAPVLQSRWLMRQRCSSYAAEPHDRLSLPCSWVPQDEPFVMVVVSLSRFHKLLASISWEVVLRPSPPDTG